MKYTLHTLTSRFLGILWLVTSVCMFVSCSDDTDETGGNFKLYYPDMTDIGPSMTGVKIPAPSFQGATPSEFEITAVTLNDESIENPCFIIDAETGEITINSTAETPVGEYKLTISCSVNGKYFTFKDIIKVTFLPRAPEGTVAEPNHILVMYSVVSDPNNITKLPTAQVKTAGEHVSITKYSIGTVTVNGEVLDKPEEMFEVSSSGEISILKSERFARGVTYSISLKLETAATGDTPCIATDILAVEVASEPFSLEYLGYNTEEGWKMPNTSNDEGGSSFISEVPIFVGSTDGIKYWIEIDNEKGKDKILIDETTGIISVPQGHGFDIGDKFNISVFVANTYLSEGKKLAELHLNITKFYKPLVDGLVFYRDTEVQQTEAFSITPNQIEGYEELLFKLLDNWEHLLNITPDGTIQAEEGNNIAVGKYKVPFRVTNGDGTYKEYTFNLNVIENQSKLLWVRCGHNYGTQYKGEKYENQYRFRSLQELKEFSAELKSNLDGVINVTYAIENNNRVCYPEGNSKACVPKFKITDNRIEFEGIKNNNEGTPEGVFVIVIKASAQINNKEVTKLIPIFFDCNNEVTSVNQEQIRIEYTPFVFHVNSRTGGEYREEPNIWKDQQIYTKKLYIDNRSNFNYYNLDKNSAVPTGQLNSGTPQKQAFLKSLYDEAYHGSETANYGTKAPFSVYDSGKDATTYDNILYFGESAENPNNTIHVAAEKWQYQGNYVNGFFRGKMIYAPNGTDYSDNNAWYSFMIWLDPDYYPVTE